jgi:hypothetical protein
MSTYREMVYLVLDKLKGLSDDFTFTEDHILFQLVKYRAFLLKQKYSDIKKHIPEQNYQTIYLTLENVNKKDEVSKYKKSFEYIPNIMNIAIPKVYDCDYMSENISYIMRDRMRFVGYNKYLNNIIYCSIYPDNLLYLKSNDTTLNNLTNVKMTAVFQDCLKALKLEESTEYEKLDNTFPLEDSLVEPLVEMVVKDLMPDVYKPSDDINNAKDDLSDMMSFIRRNMKSNLQKQIEQ